MGDLILSVFLACCVGLACFIGGKEEGHKQYYRGEIVCQEQLDKQIVCWQKDRLPK